MQERKLQSQKSREQSLGYALRGAAEAGNVLKVKKLVARGVPVDTPDECGGTALEAAAKESRLQVMSVLLDAGAMLESQSAKGAMRWAIESNHSACVEMLARRRPVSDSQRLTHVMSAVRWDRHDALAALWRVGYPKKIEDEGWSLLHEAASWGASRVLRMLLDEGADPLFRCERYGRTALHCAVDGEKKACIEMLSATAALDQRDNDGLTPLALALGLLRSAGRREAVLLARAGASPFGGKNGESLVEEARLAGSIEAWEILLAREQRVILDGVAPSSHERKAPSPRI